jgi:hypothetical protein
MPRFPFLRHARVTLLALVLVAAAAMLLLVTPPPAAAVICGPDSYLSANVTYYSGPKHKTEVGEYFGCTGDLTGEETDYYISLPVCCPGD